MRSYFLILSALLAIASAATCVAAGKDSSVEQDAKEVGHVVGEIAHDVGHGTKNAAKAVGHTTRDVTRTIGHAFRDGAKETKNTVKGKSSKGAK